MNIPNFEHTKFVDNDGNLTPEWKAILMQLIQELQKNSSNEGLFVPQQTSVNVAVLDNIKSKSALIYNSDTNQLLININGTFKVIQTL